MPTSQLCLLKMQIRVKEIAIKPAVSARCIIRKTQILIRLNVRCDATDVFGNSTFYHINLT